MRYDDFSGKALPQMMERVKINLRTQGIDYFVYGEEFEPPFLYHKSRYINEEFSDFPEQVAFEKKLAEVGLFDFSGYGPKPGDLLETLAQNRWAVDFMVEDEDMLEVAQWVVANTPFDRLYFYGENLPIHVSFGSNHDRQIVRMISLVSGGLVPRVISLEAFLNL